MHKHYKEEDIIISLPHSTMVLQIFVVPENNAVEWPHNGYCSTVTRIMTNPRTFEMLDDRWNILWKLQEW